MCATRMNFALNKYPQREIVFLKLDVNTKNIRVKMEKRERGRYVRYSQGSETYGNPYFLWRETHGGLKRTKKAFLALSGLKL